MANNRLTHIQQLVASRRAKQAPKHKTNCVLSSNEISKYIEQYDAEMEAFCKELKEKRSKNKENTINT